MPPRTKRSARAAQIVDAAHAVLQDEGREALTMRRLAESLAMRAPSLYKHFPDKAAVECALVEDALVAMGTALHAAVARPGRRTVVASLLHAYRSLGRAQPNLYRLATSGPLDRRGLAPGIEDWAGAPFFLATGEPHRAQALWSFAHGTLILEIDGRFAEMRGLDRTWRAGAEAFGG